MMLLWLAAVVLATSAISGVLGMAGGMILMGVLGAVMPVPAAMMLHGVTQLASNGFRAALLARHLRYRVLLPYAAGAAGAAVVFSRVDLVIPRSGLYLALGAIPFLGPVWERLRGADPTRPGGAVACGALVTGLHLVAGVSGPLLDQLFLRTGLPPLPLVGTKALTQVLGHGVKLLYFGALVSAPGTVAPGTCAVAVGAALVGTVAGRAVLDRLPERRFRSWSTGVIRAIGVVYLAKGAAELAGTALS
jgi:uncharacterized membrane protein YfcA